MRREFRKPRQLMAAIEKDMSDFKDDVLLALGAEMSQELSSNTAGEIKTTPIMGRDSIHIEYQGVGDENQSKRHVHAIEEVRDHISDNVEGILKRRNII